MKIAAVLLTLLLVKSVFTQNPFNGKTFFINPEYIDEVQSSINDHPGDKDLLSKAQHLSTYLWLDSMAKISKLNGYLQAAQKQQEATGSPVIALIVVYDLPDRDCAAAASNGEITCADNQCVQGIQTYQSQYVDPIVSILKNYSSLQVAAIVEPDSLPNLATNLNVAKCSQAQVAYKTGVAYAIRQLSSLSNVALYIDAAHGGWLGWPNNRQAYAQIIQQVLSAAGGPNKIRGFATNVANYQPLGSITSTNDPCHLQGQYNPAIDESHYISVLSDALSQVGITNKGYITDTSRNGVINERQDCSNWCNIKGAGLGMRPSANTTSTGLSNVDAFVWVKVPGESDGTTDTSSNRYDYHCRSQDSVIPAPEAGQWFSDYFVALCQNAVPPLS